MSVIAGIFSILILFYIALRYFGRRAAIFALILLALSPQHIFYSQMVRSYIFVLLSTSLSLFGLLVLNEDGESKWNMSIGAGTYAAGSIASIYFHSTMFLWPIIATTAAMTGFMRRFSQHRPRIVRLVVANGLVFFCTLWWLIITAAQLSAANRNINWIPPLTLSEYRLILSRAITLTRYPEGWERITILIVMGFAAAGAWLTRRKPAAQLLARVFIFSIIGFGVVGTIKPIVLDRTVFWMTGMTAVLVAAGLSAVSARVAAVCGTALISLLLLNLAHSRPKFEYQNWRGALTAVAADPAGVLVVRGEAMGIATGLACETELLVQQRCPFPMVVVADTNSSMNPWAIGLLRQSVIAPAVLRHAASAGSHYYLLEATGGVALGAIVPASAPLNRFGDLRLYGPVGMGSGH
jgi:hypothetical protein